MARRSTRRRKSTRRRRSRGGMLLTPRIPPRSNNNNFESSPFTGVTKNPPIQLKGLGSLSSEGIKRSTRSVLNMAAAIENTQKK